jgi:hypothetical protein
MLQVAPSKTDAERLLLVSPELGEVLTAIIFRVRADKAALPLVAAYDVFEQTWSPPMPFLFQRRFGTEDRDHLDLRGSLPEKVGGLDTVAVGHPQIHEDDVLMELAGQGEGFLAVGGGADYFHAGQEAE